MKLDIPHASFINHLRDDVDASNLVFRIRGFT